jgi:hypothetical protein
MVRKVTGVSRRDDTGYGRGRLPATPNEHQMSRAIYELRAPGKGLLKPFEFICQGAAAQRTHGIPTGVWRKPTVKQVKTS